MEWVLGDRSGKTFKPLWEKAEKWHCYFYITDGWKVYPNFIAHEDQIVCKTYMTRVEGENTRLRHYLARLHRKTLCYSKSVEWRIVNYHYFSWEKISSIGSGAVESAVKQIGHRVKLTGAQWKKENVPQVLQLRCAYLNGQLAI